MKVFLSHTSRDGDFAARLASDLREQGCNVFTYFEAITPGESVAERIGTAILESDAVLILLSEHSARSPWVSSEIALARARWEKGEPRRIIPIVIARSADIPFFIKDLVYLDLSDEDKYQGNLPSLVKALRESKTETRDAAKSRRVREEMIQARKAAMVLERQFHSNQQSFRQHFILTSMATTGFATILVSLMATFLALTTKITWMLVVLVSLGVAAAIQVVMLFFFQWYRRYDLRRSARILNEMQSELARLHAKEDDQR